MHQLYWPSMFYTCPQRALMWISIMQIFGDLQYLTECKIIVWATCIMSHEAAILHQGNYIYGTYMLSPQSNIFVSHSQHSLWLLPCMSGQSAYVLSWRLSPSIAALARSLTISYRLQRSDGSWGAWQVLEPNLSLSSSEYTFIAPSTGVYQLRVDSNLRDGNRFGIITSPPLDLFRGKSVGIKLVILSLLLIYSSALKNSTQQLVCDYKKHIALAAPSIFSCISKL